MRMVVCAQMRNEPLTLCDVPDCETLAFYVVRRKVDGAVVSEERVCMDHRTLAQEAGHAWICAPVWEERGRPG